MSCREPEVSVAGRRQGTDALLERQRRRESSARSYPRRLPIVPTWAQGCEVRDHEGRTYLDCLSGAGSLALGHHHPAVVAALRQALDDSIPLTTLDLATPVKDRFVETLFGVLPAHLADGCIQFCGPTGADGVEAALKLAKTSTGRTGVIAFGGGYHGMTQATLAVSGNRDVAAPLGPLLPDVHHVPFPTALRGPLGTGVDAAARCGDLVDWALADARSGVPQAAAVLVEPVQGEGGVHPLPEPLARRLRRATEAAGAVLVADEVQTGLGRTGTLWASDPIGLEPDVLVLSKAIGGGLPLAVVVYRRELDGWEPGAHAGTFRGNQLAMVAGEATLRVVVAEGLPERAAVLGRRLMEGLQAESDGHQVVGDVRGRGLMVGIELVDPTRADRSGAPAPDGELAGRIQASMLEHGVICEVGGADDAVVRLLPPLTITRHELDRVVDAFGRSVRAVVAERSVA